MKTAISLILLAMSLIPIPASFAEISVQQGGGASCAPLLTTLRSRWSDVRNHMQPHGESIRSPKSEDFICLSPYAIRNATERRLSSGARLKCFTRLASDGLGICCDDPVTACVQLNPALFPELMRKRQKKEEKYEPPKSNWVRPPSEEDQWKSN